MLSRGNELWCWKSEIFINFRLAVCCSINTDSLSRCKPTAARILLPAVISVLLFLKIHVAMVNNNNNKCVGKQPTCWKCQATQTSSQVSPFLFLCRDIASLVPGLDSTPCKPRAPMTLFYKNTVECSLFLQLHTDVNDLAFKLFQKSDLQKCLMRKETHSTRIHAIRFGWETTDTTDG